MPNGAGGGGGGGTIVGVGNSFTGAAQALEIYGDFAAAYSGQLNINTSTVDHLRFTTGNYLFIGEFQLFGATQYTAGSLGAGDISLIRISFNDGVLFVGKVDTEQEDMPTELKGPIAIPAYTEVLVEVISTASTAGFFTSANIIGRIYRG